MRDFVVVAEGLSELSDFDKIPDKIVVAARQAINRTAEWAKAQAAQEMRRQVNFKARYLTGKKGGLSVKKATSSSSLEATITGRHRPTSLANFVRNTSQSAVRKKGGATVQVKPGAAKYMKGTFMVRLRRGSSLTDTQHNMGLAIRLKPGESLRNKTGKLTRLAPNVYLLYGPSVDQVFRTISSEMTDEVADYLQQEFSRLKLIRNL